jgi:predicted enzyme related to lactoylglutathione lyase
MTSVTRTVTAAAVLTVAAVATAARAEVTLNSARVGAEDVAAAEKFYEDAFGLKEVNRLEFPGTVEVMLNFGATMDAAKANGAAQIVIMTRESDDIADAVPHIIFNVTDVAAIAKAVVAAGGTMDGEPQPFGDTGIVIGFAKDPAGNRIELIQQPAGR